MTGARPIYENAASLTAEDGVIRALCGAWRCEAKKLPRSYGLDYLLLRGGLAQAACEVKVRGRRYDTLFLSLHKVAATLQFSHVSLPSFLVVAWPDGLYWRELSFDAGAYLGFGGRTDRNDPADLEPVVHWPASSFRRIEATA